MVIALGALVFVVVLLVIGKLTAMVLSIGSRNSTRRMMRGKVFRRTYMQYREEAERLDAEYRRRKEGK